jgi:hypothetical protein
LSLGYGQSGYERRNACRFKMLTLYKGFNDVQAVTLEKLQVSMSLLLFKDKKHW